MKQPTITFIGGGHIATAIIGGLIDAGYSPARIWVTCPTAQHLHTLQQRFAVQTTQDNCTGAARADIIILAVKPQVMHDVLVELKTTIAEHQPLVISVAASMSEGYLRSILGDQASVVLAMPNMPALIGYSMTVLYAGDHVSARQKQQAYAIFASIGATAWLQEENQMVAVTAVSGSGPAYFFLLAEALQEVAIELGLSADVAQQLTVQTALGAAQMMLKSEHAAATLRRQVTSPGGGTERALQVLESGKFKQLLFEAVRAARDHYASLNNPLPNPPPHS